MERPVQYHNSLIWVCVLILLSHCSRDENVLQVNANDPSLKIENGLLMYLAKPITGIVFTLSSETNDTLARSSYREGKEHGEWKQFYAKSRLREKRYFNNGDKTGDLIDYWPNGKMQLHYVFVEGEYSGECREWNDSGLLTKCMHYKNGHEEGLQQWWYDNGKIKANYLVKNGRRFGLLGTKNCINASDSVFTN